MGSCDVCLYGADVMDIENEFYSESVVTARKPHACHECRQPIRPRERYQRAAGKSDGGLFTIKTCTLCAEIRSVFYCGGGYIFGELWSDMKEQAFPHLTTASECFRELSLEAKAIVLDRWAAWRGLRQHEGGRE